MTLETMTTLYNLFSAAHAYILGFVLYGRVYYVPMDFKTLCQYCKLDHASSAKGGGAKVRIKIRAKEKQNLLRAARLIGLEDELVGLGKNLGDNFERMVTEKLAGQKWHKDSTPFNLAGDVRINGTEIQVKFDGATLVTQKTLERLTAEG